MKKSIVSLLLAGTLTLAAITAAAPFSIAETAIAEEAAQSVENTENMQNHLHEGRCVSDLIADQDGSFLAVDSCNKVIWRLKDGAAEQYAGKKTQPDLYGIPVGGYVDGSLEESAFGLPWAIAPFLDGYAVSDAANHAIRLVRENGVETINGRTEEPLTVTELGVAFDYPTGLAADDEGNLYVSDTHQGAVRKISKDGMVTTVADELADPMGLYWFGETLYIAETGANRIIKLNLQSGEKQILAGTGEQGNADGPVLEAQFAGPQRITGDADGTLYVSDTGNGYVRCITDGQVTTVKTEERLFCPAGILLQGHTLLICDSFAHQIYQVELDGAS